MAAKRKLSERLGWTGFFAYANAEGKPQRGKTLWDWMQLLVIPIMLAVGSLWFSYSNKQSDLALAENRLQEERLSAYLAKIEGYILDRDLLSAKDKGNLDIIRMAQVQTVTALRSMDDVRQGLVIYFLRDSGLIDFIFVNAALAGVDLSEADLSGVYLSEADLSEADLREADLREADLRGADLRGANLIGTILRGANLSKADLRRANLSGANLSGACLSGAIVTEAQLDSAKWAEGAIMPDEEFEKCLNR